MPHHREGMAGSSACPPARPTEFEADHHNHTVDDAGEQSLASTTRRPQHRSSSRFALRALRVDPAPRPTLLPNRRPPSKNAHTTVVDGPAPLRNGATVGSRGACPTLRRYLTQRCAASPAD